MSLTVCAEIKLSAIVPCGLWHEPQAIFSSRTGMCAFRNICERWIEWQLLQVSISVLAERSPSREWFFMTEWQLEQLTSAESWTLASQ